MAAPGTSGMSQSNRWCRRRVNVGVPVSAHLTLSNAERDELATIAQSRSLPAGYVFRAKLILLVGRRTLLQRDPAT